MHNRAFWRAMHSLAHPVSVGAVVLLLLNDHLLRHQWPSWWTGKLGDFAWLVFAPFICAAVLPHRKMNERYIGVIAFGFIAVWFATAKTIPAVHALTTGVLEAIIGWKGTLRLDVTDLLTLPALLIGWYIWQNAPNTPMTLSPRVWPVLALGIIATLASDVPRGRSQGISSIQNIDGKLVALVCADSRFVENILSSPDGGFTWKNESGRFYSFDKCYDENPEPIRDPNNSQTLYRFLRGERIEKSTDGGQKWNQVYDLSFYNQDVRISYHLHQYGEYAFVSYSPGPFDGVVDANTGNVLFAMGWDGVLIQTQSGEWKWIGIGLYKLENLGHLHLVSSVLFFELWLAGALFFLVMTTSAAYLRQAGFVRVTVLGIGWIAWFILPIFYMTPYHLDNNFEIAGVAFMLLIFVAIPLIVGAIVDFMLNFRRLLWQVARVGSGNALLFLFPFVLWTQGTIPLYRTALVFSILLTAGGLRASYHHLMPLLQTVPPYKPLKANDDAQ